MQINYKHITLSLTVCAALAACTDEVSSIFSPENGKTPIELSIGGVDVQEMSRAQITDGTSHTMQNFDKAANIFMVMKSEYGTTDFEGEHTDKYTVSRGTVAQGQNTVNFDTNNQKYWDDAHARSSQLSIWAYASKCPSNWYECNFQVPNPDWTAQEPETYEHLKAEYQDKKYTTSGYYGWELQGAKGSKGAIYPCIMTWKASHKGALQDAETVQYQDLLFSNNLADNGTDKDGRLKFNFTTRKFPTGVESQMNFYHAMSKITIHIKKGDGFTSSFNFNSGNITLKKFNTEGTFNIKDGEFQQIKATYDIPQIYQHTTPDAGDAYTLEALAVPNIHEFLNSHGSSDVNSRFVKNAKNLDTDVMMEFTIENNKYQLTSGDLYYALVDGSDNPVTNATKKEDNGTYIPLEPGKNYVFTFTVGKQKINNITAKVADWETVSATELLPTNARVQVALEDRGTPVTSNIDLYRCPEEHTEIADDYKNAYTWKTGYIGYTADGNDDGKADPFTCTAGKWTTDWFWPHNKMYYHFRALSSNAGAVTTDATNGDFVSLAHAETSYTDVTWGAPFKDIADDAKITYDPETHGFDGSASHQINYGIGPTENTIKMLMFHMMSDVTINVTSEAGSAQVQLGNGSSTFTTIELKNINKAGKVALGNGLVSTTDSKSNFLFTNHPAPVSNTVTWANYGAIPQSLEDVQLVITTADHNQYIVDMADVKATSVTSHNITNPYNQEGGKFKIDQWYPGFQYTYTFKLNKKDITDITATILQWEEVTAGDDNVQIK